MIEQLLSAMAGDIGEWLLFSILVFIIVYFIRRYELGRLELREKLKREMFKNESMDKMDKMKSHFFADISHELRTPLTLINGQIESVINTATPEEKSKLQIAQKHGVRLLLLIDQLLELSMLDAQSIKLRTSVLNIVSFVKSLLISFEPIATSRDILLEFRYSDNEIFTLFDPDKMEQAVCNLISNAFKFTGSPGLIQVEVLKDEKGFVEIKVGDNGPGIDTADVSLIFSRFYRGEGAVKRKNQGAGIGLSIAKELVELHEGKILVENRSPNGAVFTIRFPLNQTTVSSESVYNNQIN